jgi:RNA polymerase sigma-70 factor (ECF subfamily)
MDQRGFESMVRTHSSDLYRFAYWLSRDKHLAQDLVQEAFSAAWKAFDSLRDKEAAKPWLFSILRNEYARSFQRKRLDIQDGVELEELSVSVPAEGQERVELENLLQALPENYREPLMLQVLGGFSGREIAQMLNITEQNVMVRLTRARHALRRLVDPEQADEDVDVA